jgi:hypothetical protein
MNIEMAKHFLLWCTVINYGLLLLWFVLVAFCHDWWYRINKIFFKVSLENFDALNYGGIAIYKLGIILFNLVPLIALWIVG